MPPNSRDQSSELLGPLQFMYEPSIRIPLIVRYPRLGISGDVTNAMVMNVDFAPTIIDLAGLSIPEGMQGQSLRPYVQGKVPANWRNSIYYAYYEDSWKLHGRGEEAMAEPYQYFTPHRIGPHRGVRTERYKLIDYYGEGDYWELFDLECDPNELQNRYYDPDYADIVSLMTEELEKLRNQYRDI